MVGGAAGGAAAGAAARAPVGQITLDPSPLTNLLKTILTPEVAAFLPTLGTAAMPVFLALTAWGFLGKLDKYFRGQAR